MAERELTPEQRAEAKAVCGAASPGPWVTAMPTDGRNFLHVLREGDEVHVSGSGRGRITRVVCGAGMDDVLDGERIKEWPR